MTAPITARTTLEELSARVSQALASHGIHATLSGGAAVTLYTDNEYQSLDLDFVTSARNKEIGDALAPLGFRPERNRRYFVHDKTRYLLEFPPGPLEFGNRVIGEDEVATIDTDWGPLKVITPTQSVMDRLAAFWHWNDRQSWDQAVMIVRHHQVDFDELNRFAVAEGRNPADISRLMTLATR